MINTKNLILFAKLNYFSIYFFIIIIFQLFSETNLPCMRITNFNLYKIKIIYKTIFKKECIRGFL